MLDIVEECVMRGVEQAAAQMNFTLGELARLVRSQIRRPCDRVRGRVSPVHIKLREYHVHVCRTGDVNSAAECVLAKSSSGSFCATATGVNVS